MNFTGVILLAGVFACEPVLGDPVAASNRKSFTVEDSIEMPRVLPIDGVARADASFDAALYSPDRSHLVLRTRRGDLSRNVNVDALVLFKTQAVRDYLHRAASGTKPGAVTLVERAYSEDWGGMSHIQWIDDHRVGFVAEGDNARNQVFVTDVRDSVTSQLTRSPTSVQSFAVAGDTVLYLARVPPRQPADVVALGEQSLGELLWWQSDPQLAPLELFRSSRSEFVARRLDAAAIFLGPLDSIWLSPSGRYALTQTPSIDAPAHWAEYQAASDYWRYGADRVLSDPTSAHTFLRVRYQLVDLESGKVRPLMDAPSGSIAFNETPQVAFWVDSERSVIVSNTYLPLDVTDRRVREARREGPVIAEVNLQTGAVSEIMREPMVSLASMQKGETLRPILSIGWQASASELRVIRQGASGRTHTDVLRKTSGKWRRVQTNEAKADDLSIRSVETLNDRPRVQAHGGACACAKEIYDPAPRAEEFEFARVEHITFEDKNRIIWHAGLVYPRGYVAGQRYPLVVQTHGFGPQRFLLDGPGGGTAFAAQALAAEGFVVLQIADIGEATTSDERQGPLYAEGFRAAIQKVVGDGIADAGKVGLIAFSATGLAAIHLLAEQPHLLRAVNISDSIQPSYVQDVLLSTMPKPYRDGARKVMGGGPYEVGYEAWFRRSPLYKLGAIDAAVRIEAIDPGSAISMAETYAVLKEAGRAVDFIYFPRGSHNLQKPAERLGSQGGNFDWFRFWLQGHEDPSEQKSEQYRRWRELRARQQLRDSGS